MSRRREPARRLKAFDRYEIRTGSAGFVVLMKNGRRIQPKNTVLRFNVRRSEKQQIKKSRPCVGGGDR